MTIPPKNHEIASAIQKKYPSHNKFIYSMAMQPNKYGITLCSGARKIKNTLLHVPEKRSKTKRVAVRVSDSLAYELKKKMAEENISQQDLLENLLVQWVKDSGKGGK